VLEAVLEEVVAGVARIRRQGIERAGNHLNRFQPPQPATPTPAP